MFTRNVSKKIFSLPQFSTKVVGESKNIFAKYDEFLVKRPLLTKCITSAGLSLGADLICQIGFSDEFAKKMYGDIKIDWKRALKFTAIGGIFVAPTLHYWYGLLATKIPGASMLAVLKRLSFDQLLFAPLFLPCFFSCALILDGTPELILPKLEKDWLTTVVTNYAVWVPCQFINFKFMPPHLQVLFANVVGFFWNIYLSYSCYNTSPTSSDANDTVNASQSSARVVELLNAETLVQDEVLGEGPPVTNANLVSETVTSSDGMESKNAATQETEAREVSEIAERDIELPFETESVGWEVVAAEEAVEHQRDQDEEQQQE